MHRRNFLNQSVTCGAHVLGLACFAPTLLRSAFAFQDADKVVVEEKWGRLEKVHEGVWALISTPFQSQDFTTVCNGGIIKGDKGVVVVESFMQPEGATWMAEQAKKLTGSYPTDIVSTHFHADHTGGHLGFYKDGRSPRLWLTDSTKTAAEKSFKERKMADNNFKNVVSIDAKEGATIDLGNRSVKLVPRSGHTSSDVTVELVEPKVVWCGDLFFNRMFPNYGDAIPSRLNTYVDSIIAAPDVTYVPGHGPVADLEALKKYKEFLAHIQSSATAAFKAGKAIEEETKDYKMIDSLSEWMVWSPDNATKAFAAWYRELEMAKTK
ncbi:MAG: MBL fold metallo-hydrolase [Mariniblastus sp.]